MANLTLQDWHYLTLEEAVKDKKINLTTLNRVKVAKEYIEKKYKMKKEKEKEDKLEWEAINEKIIKFGLEKEKTEIKKEILHKQAENIRSKRKKINIFDFSPISIIGKGAFGEVRVCRYNKNNEIFAIKKLNKEEMFKKNQIIHVRHEKDILTLTDKTWVVDLKYSFQDAKYLYLVMDFLPGGDLMSQLIKKDIFSETEGKFYMAEMVLAVESIHNINCIHRDLKPDNILIDSNGHIRLSDFGLSKLMDNNIYTSYYVNNINDKNNPRSNDARHRRQVSIFYIILLYIIFSIVIQLLVLQTT